MRGAPGAAEVLRTSAKIADPRWPRRSARPGAGQDRLDIGAAEGGRAEKTGRALVQINLRLARHGHEHLAQFSGRLRVEERDVLLTAPLTLEVHGEQVGTAREEEPDQFASVARVAHLRGQLREDARAGARVARVTPVAHGGVRLVHDDGHGAQFAQTSDASMFDTVRRVFAAELRM